MWRARALLAECILPLHALVLLRHMRARTRAHWCACMRMRARGRNPTRVWMHTRCACMHAATPARSCARGQARAHVHACGPVCSIPRARPCARALECLRACMCARAQARSHERVCYGMVVNRGITVCVRIRARAALSCARAFVRVCAKRKCALRAGTSRHAHVARCARCGRALARLRVRLRAPVRCVAPRAP